MAVSGFTLSLHDALPISTGMVVRVGPVHCLPSAPLDALPLALRRRVVRTVLDDLHGRPLAAAAVDGVLSLAPGRSEEHTSELQSRPHLVCRLLLEKQKLL